LKLHSTESGVEVFVDSIERRVVGLQVDSADAGLLRPKVTRVKCIDEVGLYVV
jgi:hypothetical protein